MAENNVQDQDQIKLPDPIIFTDAASLKVKELIDEEGNPNLKLRVFVQGGGCSGFQYGFTFDETTNEDDAVMVRNGVTLLIDSMSYQYLVGAEIDYKEDLEGAQFVIKNPNATTQPAAAAPASPSKHQSTTESRPPQGGLFVRRGTNSPKFLNLRLRWRSADFPSRGGQNDRRATQRLTLPHPADLRRDPRLLSPANRG